jgi:Putative auto-transporter adhesin, head GIN domain
MSELTNYNGNFVKLIDSFTIESKQSKKFTFAGNICNLDVDIYCKLLVIPDDNISVEIITEDIEQFKLSFNDGILLIKQELTSCDNSNVFTNMTMNFSGNAVINNINGKLFVNGIDVKPSTIIVRCPQNIDLTANLSGDATFASKVIFKRSKIKVSGQGTIGLATESLKLNMSGQSDSYFVLRGGDVDISLSGQGSVKIKGTWSDTEISLSGMGSVSTNGVVTGYYDATVSGMGRVNHTGDIKGNVKKRMTGMGNININ